MVKQMKYAFYGKYQEEDKQKITFLDYDEKNPDIVFSFGGDGTMLGAIHKYMDCVDKVKFVGIKTGSLGFFTDFEYQEFDQAIERIKNKEYKENKYKLLKFVFKNNNHKEIGYAVNEVSLVNPIHTQIIEVFIDGKLFEVFRGTGLLVSTPTGSTAYNKSLGGSIIDPKIEAFQLTEIAAINNTVYNAISSPLILSKKTKLVLRTKESSNIYLSVDGKEYQFTNLTETEVSLADKQVNIISKKDTLFWDRVRKAFLR
jgi:NAD+ kinase